MQKKRLCYAAAMAVLLPNAAAAAEIVITAERWPQPIEQTTASTSVITAQELEALGEVSVAEALQRLAGVEITTNGGWGKQTSLFLRGTNSGHVAVFIDGTRVGSATTGAFDWANLSTAAIERIEIVRGPQSGLYGADAIGGVVRIFTKKGAAKPQLSLLAEAGGLGSAHGRATASASNEAGLRYALGVDVRRTKGVSAYAKGTEPDPAQMQNAQASIEAPLAGGALSLAARWADGTTALDGGFPFGDLVGYQQRLRQATLSASYEYPVSERWQMRLFAGTSSDALQGFDANNPTNNYAIRTRMDQWSWEHRILVAEGVQLRAGIEQRFALGINDANQIHHRRMQLALFAGGHFHRGALDLDVALRRDRNSYTSDRTTGRAGVRIALPAALSLRASYGTGFKAPTLNDLFWPATPWSAGNPNLKPEDARGWDAAIEWRPWQGDARRLSLSAGYFAQDVRNLIQWAQVRPFFWQPSNVGHARITGWEFALEAGMAGAFLRASYTVQNPRNLTDQKLLARRAKEHAAVAVGYADERFGGSLSVRIIGPRFDDARNQTPLAGYHLVHARAWLALGDGLRLVGRVENLENKHYEPMKNYGARPRVVWLGIELGA